MHNFSTRMKKLTKESQRNYKPLETVAKHNFSKWKKNLTKEWTGEWNPIQIPTPGQKLFL